MTLQQLRRRIDRIDRQLLRLLNRRAATALQIGRLKKRRRLPVLDEAREKAVLLRMVKTNTGPLSRASIHGIFREILRHSRRLQGQP